MPTPLPAEMRAAVYRKPREIEITGWPTPRPGPDDVVVEVSHCGICGTDLHLFLDGFGVRDSIGGHEYAGRIAAVGANVRDWAVGDPVVGGPQPGCGRCRACHAGRPVLCDQRDAVGTEPWFGAYADYVRIDRQQLCRIPEGLDLRTAALAEPLAVALHAITLARSAEAAERVFVTGAGPLALLLVATLRTRGVKQITVSEPHEARRNRALAVGATQVVRPDELMRPVMPFEVLADAADVAFECSGQPSATETALAQLRRGGTLVLVGTGGKPPALDTHRVILNELIVTGAFNYDVGGFDEALRLLASGELPTEDLIEPEEVPLDGLLTAMERLARGELTRKVMVRPPVATSGEPS